MKYIVLLCLLLMLSGCYIPPPPKEYDISYRKEGVKYPLEGVLININSPGCDSGLDIMGRTLSNLEENIGTLLTNKNIRYNFYPIKASFYNIISGQYWTELKDQANSMNMQGYIYIYIYCKLSGSFKYIYPNVAINYSPIFISYVFIYYFYIASNDKIEEYSINYKNTAAYMEKARTLHNSIFYLSTEPVGAFPMDEVLKWIDKVTNP